MPLLIVPALFIFFAVMYAVSIALSLWNDDEDDNHDGLADWKEDAYTQAEES